ncbi:MAG: AAA family ATPase [Spirochaetales bacterium]|jgi:DNA repair exonuclease SbcCD ATPase subunit|nr:AAA family ATPase [Spirochaetales bacterium]
MIETLNLTDFGKFKKRRFDFKPVTLFLGENETGKSTLFDAIFDKICAPKGNSAEGRRLKSRYGETRQAELTGDAPRISESDFLNLYAVKAGSAALEIDNNSEAINIVKASLFSGGIDPKIPADSLIRAVKARGRDSLSEGIKQAEQDIGRLKSDLERDYGIRKNYLFKEAEIKQKDAALEEAEKKIALLEESGAALEKAVKDQRLIKDEKQFTEIISLISDLRRRRENVKKYASYSAETLEKIKNLENAEKDCQNEIDAAAKNLEAALKEAAVKAGEKNALEKEQHKFDRVKILADSLKDRIYPKERLIEKKSVLRINKVFIAIAFLFTALGVFLFFNVPPRISFFVLAGGLVLALAFLICAFRKQTVDDVSRLRGELESLRERWRRETGGELEESYEGILLALENASRDAEFALENYTRSCEAAAAAEEKARALMGQKAQGENRYAGVKRELTGALSRAGVSGATEYAAALARKESETEGCAEIEKKVRLYGGEYGGVSEDALEDALRLKIKNIRETAPPGELTENELRRLEIQLSENRKMIAALQKTRGESISSVSRDRGETHAVFGELPQKITEEEKALGEAEARLGELKREIRASEIAGEIFSSLSEDAGRMLVNLSEEIKTVFSSFTSAGQTKVREVGLKSFSLSDSVTVSDELGTPRDLAHLSAGTRDAFFLAARLILAAKSQGGGKKAPIIFDESFTALDRPRTERALKILEEFRQKTGVQIVIFTKDFDLEEPARAVFGDALGVNRL